jgi:hypothetical protein
MHRGDAVKVTHFLELGWGAVGQIPTSAGGKTLDHLGFAQAVRAPDANGCASPSEARDFVVSVENMG